MNQVLSSPPPSSLHADRLNALRAEIAKAGLDGYLVPMADAYQNEYVPACWRRIEYLTGFTGSYAFIVVLAEKAAFFTDSRYTLQASAQVPESLYAFLDISKKSPSEWLLETLRPQMKIGFDPALHTVRQIERIETSLLKINASLTPVDENLVDIVWTDRPAPPCAPAFAHDPSYAGKSSAAKRHEQAEELRKRGLSAAILTDLASIAWILNVRGDDIPMVPLPLSKAILYADATVEWFIDPHKMTKGLDIHLGTDIHRYEEAEFVAALRRLGEARSRVLIDPDETPYGVLSVLRQSGAAIEKGEDPCSLPRACKNMTEIEGMRAAHRRDGAALVKFMAWFDGEAEDGNLTEMDAIEKLESFRAGGSLYRGPSFETIAGTGGNGAIVHYHATSETNGKIAPGHFLLLDSGGHYLDGTTDVTRTLPVGDVTTEMKDRYTRVLKGLIALSTIRFPEGTTGAELDTLARQFLWAEGLDYGHGTGHGVGSYSCVHEGPQGISSRNNVPLKPGMVVSNEPGYYKPRHYGIRLENLQCVVELFEISSPERKMFGFEPLTLAPFDKRVIAREMLTNCERDWLNAYHARVCKALRPQLDERVGAWLSSATSPL